VTGFVHYDQLGRRYWIPHANMALLGIAAITGGLSLPEFYLSWEGPYVGRVGDK
jgi:hypothetical protein